MKILITGDRGFIGQNAVNRFYKDYEISTYDYSPIVFPDVSKFDWVMHFGAISSTTETNVEKVMEQNYDFTCRLIDDCIKYGTNIQYSSSASVYGLGDRFTEDAPVDPRTPYAWSKYMIEKYATRKRNTGIVIQGFRYFNVYGPHEEHKQNQASPYCQFEQQANKNGEIRIFEKSHLFKRDFIHVNEVLDCHVRFLNVTQSGIWNIGTGKATSFLEVAQQVIEKSSRDVKLTTIPMPSNLLHSYQKYTCADMTKTMATAPLLLRGNLCSF